MTPSFEADLIEKIERAADILKALAHPIRLDIMISLESYEMTVGTLAMALEYPQYQISKHLKILSTAGLVTMERRNKEHVYRVADLDQARAITSLIIDEL